MLKSDNLDIDLFGHEYIVKEKKINKNIDFFSNEKNYVSKNSKPLWVQHIKVNPNNFIVYNKQVNPDYVKRQSNKINFVKKIDEKAIELELQELRNILSLNPDNSPSFIDQRVNNKKTELLKALKTKQKDISQRAQRRLLRCLDYMLFISKNKFAENYKRKKLFTYKLAMVTLDLPSEQIHDDIFIKKNLLGAWLDVMRKMQGIKNYIWKAEKQKNGNIHFHIIIDKWIHYKDINRYWNQVLEKYGYIDNYRKNQLKFHENGFKPRPELFKHWSLKSQINAYKEGIRSNWSMPVATSDIHSLKKIKNVRAYLGKYITKNPDKEKLLKDLEKDYCKKNNVTEISLNIRDELKKTVLNKMSIKGNIWYICRNLSGLKQTSKMVEGNENLENEINQINQNFNEKIIEKDHCLIYCLNIYEVFKFGFTSIFNVFKEFIIEQRNKFYPPGENGHYKLGLPLPLFE